MPRRSPTRSARKRFGPGRSAFLKKHNLENQTASNIWYQYSGRLRCDIVINSVHSHFDHFCWLEGEESISVYELRPAAFTYVAGDQLTQERFQAIATPRSGRPQLHKVCRNGSAASDSLLRAIEAAGFDYVCFDPEVLQGHCLVRNWRRALAFLSAARHLPLDPACNELASFFKVDGQLSLGQVLERTKAELQSLYTAAVFRSLQEGWLQSDLATNPLCKATLLSVREVSHA